MQKKYIYLYVFQKGFKANLTCHALINTLINCRNFFFLFLNERWKDRLEKYNEKFEGNLVLYHTTLIAMTHNLLESSSIL